MCHRLISASFPYNSPIGTISVGIGTNGIKRIALETASDTNVPPYVTRLFDWFDRYFAGKRPPFPDIPLEPTGTPFQRAVWAKLKLIPYGATVTYGEMAGALASYFSGGKTSPRALGGAVGANPLPILVPCHRVVAKNGLGGFAWGLEIKKFLLELESQNGNTIKN